MTALGMRRLRLTPTTPKGLEPLLDRVMDSANGAHKLVSSSVSSSIGLLSFDSL